MERYEINKYKESFKSKINDMFQALKIEEAKKRLEILDKEMAEPDFWQDSKHAQTVIGEANVLK